MILILNERNGRGRKKGRRENEREEAKKRKISKRIVNRITRDSHNEKAQQQYSWNNHEKT
jgi:hypothetical protein